MPRTSTNESREKKSFFPSEVGQWISDIVTGRKADILFLYNFAAPVPTRSQLGYLSVESRKLLSECSTYFPLAGASREQPAFWAAFGAGC